MPKHTYGPYSATLHEGKIYLELPGFTGNIADNLAGTTTEQKSGMQPYVLIDYRGLNLKRNDEILAMWQVTKNIPRAAILNTIREDELAGDLPLGSMWTAVELMVSDQFEESGLARRYLPRQPEE